MIRRGWVLVLFLCLGFGLSGSQTVQAATEDEYFELMKLFVDSFEQIDRNFVEKVDRRELVEAEKWLGIQQRRYVAERAALPPQL